MRGVFFIPITLKAVFNGLFIFTSVEKAKCQRETERERDLPSLIHYPNVCNAMTESDQSREPGGQSGAPT